MESLWTGDPTRVVLTQRGRESSHRVIKADCELVWKIFRYKRRKTLYDLKTLVQI